MSIATEAEVTDFVPETAKPSAATVRVATGGPRPVRTEPAPVRWAITTIALAFLAIFIVLPLVTVFQQAFARGWDVYAAAITDPDALHAIKLTLTAAAIAVVLNVVFGLVMAWAVAKFEFKGKSFLITLIDLPFSVSPVVAGLIFVLVFGAQGFFGDWFIEHD